MSASAQLLLDFVAAGNVVEGNPSRHIGGFVLDWAGRDNRLVFAEGVTLTHVKINFLGNNGQMKIDAGATLKGNFVIGQSSKIMIGANTFLNRPCDLRAMEGADIIIGCNCLFSNVKIMTSDLHSVLDANTMKRTNPAQSVVVEDEVWLSEDVKISKGGRVGHGSIIAGGSLVIRPIAPMCIGAGRPAKVVKAGVTWDRKLQPARALAAASFKVDDIPFDKDVLRALVLQKHHEVVIAVVEAKIATAGLANLPNFAKWYLVTSRYALHSLTAADINLLDDIIDTMPKHKAATNLRRVLIARLEPITPPVVTLP